MEPSQLNWIANFIWGIADDVLRDLYVRGKYRDVILMPELLNLKEGAAELKVSVHTVRAWIYQKRIPFVHLGRRVLLRKEDLEELVEKNLVKAREND